MTVLTLEQALNLHESGSISEAEEAYLEILSEEPENAEAMKLLGVLNCQQQNYEEGVSYLEAAVEVDDSISEYHQVLGHAYLAVGKVEEGISSLLKAGDLDPGRAEIYGALGDTYQQIQQFEDALKAYQRAIVIEPDVLQYKNNAGLSAVFAGQFEIAEEYLAQVIAEDENISSAHYGLAFLRANAGDKESALRDVSKALALEPENPEYLRLKAEIES